MLVKNKVVVVTGGGSGIGRELVLELLRRGAEVAAIDRREEGLRETSKLADAGPRLTVHTLDVTDRDGVEKLPSVVIGHHGPVDVVINNAGVIQPFVPLNDLDYDVIDRMIQVNLYGTIHMVKAFLPFLLERPEAHLVNVSSMGGFIPFPGQTMYGAAKAAVKLMTEGLYAELLDTSVHVTVVMPGAVATSISENSGIAVAPQADDDSAMQAMPANEAAETILDGIEDDKVHILVGSDAKLLSAASRIAPEAATRFIQKRMKSLLQPES